VKNPKGAEDIKSAKIHSLPYMSLCDGPSINEPSIIGINDRFNHFMLKIRFFLLVFVGKL